MKPTKCPLAVFDVDLLDKDKRLLREEKSECLLPALAIKKGYFSDEVTGRLHTPAGFLCPAMYTDGGDYTSCDFFSKWWWYQRLHGKTKKKFIIKQKRKKNVFVPDFPISDGTTPLTLSSIKDRKTIMENWSKFKLKPP